MWEMSAWNKACAMTLPGPNAVYARNGREQEHQNA